ncbi:NTP hydrolase p-loop-containing [Candidatus Magnetomoraceae bacterium gMMP-15]
MEKFFNIAGPCNSEEHYMLPSQARCKGLIKLINQKQYFVIHAARQSGKTTFLLDLVQKLNASSDYYALYCSLESIQKIDDPEKGLPSIVRSLKTEVEFNEALDGYTFADKADYSDFNNVLKKSLVYFCKKLNKPIVLLFDEVDCLSNGTLILFLRQLRDGFVNRYRIPFIHSIGLIGMRNIRDYKAEIREESQTLGSASPFNIIKKAMTLKNFTKQEVTDLLAQHTEQTGQSFSSEVIKKIYYYTQGQPWLVNAIATEIVDEILESDFSKNISLEHVEQAVQTIINRRDTHIDSLLERLKEKRVQKVVEPVIIGEDSNYDPLDDDFQYVIDLGLIKDDTKHFLMSNPIYSEVVIRNLSMLAQRKIHEAYSPAYFKKDQLDMNKLLIDFQEFWRENSQIWIERYQYKEAAPHLILMAFLQRVLNGGGSISRELASGRRRLDLCVHYKGNRYPIELKIRYNIKTYEDGKKQLADYMDIMNCDKGWLIVFDKRKSVSWKKKIFWKTAKIDKKEINIVGC